MKKLRSILFNLLGAERYLGLVSSTYIKLVKLGFFKKSYPELFFLNKLIKPDFVCLDIGANVGYYSTVLARLSKQVYAVEPVPMFAAIFKNNVAAYNNVTLFNVALGAENKKITMGTPMVDGVFRHGLTKVLDSNEEAASTYEVDMVIPDELFKDFTRLDYLKCDVEGYEVHLFPHLVKTLEKFKPLIQIEISAPENREAIYQLLSGMGYSAFGLQNNGLSPLGYEQYLNYEGGDYYFKSN